MAIFMSDARGNKIYAPDFCCTHLSEGELAFRSNDPGNVSEFSDGSARQLGKDRPSIYEVIEKWVEPKDREDTQMIGKREQPNPDGKG